MPNNIALFKKYTDLLDEVYKVSATSSVLDMDGALVQAGANANEIIIPKMSMDGLADYDRNSGYVAGDVEITNETVKFNYERGRKFAVDAMDNEETAGVAFGKLSSEFIRLKVAPEIDAFRYATYAGVADIGSTFANLSTGDSVLTALLVANSEMDEAEVPKDERYLFITPTLYNIANAVDSYKSRSALEKFTKIIEVPQTRFYTAINMLDGKSEGEKQGGYTKNAESGRNINFLIVQKGAAIQFSKHVVNKIFSPDQNQNADAWQFCYNAYGLTDAYENKAAGIYLHAAEI